MSSTSILSPPAIFVGMAIKQLPKESLALNLAHLMERQGHSERDLAKLAKVSQKAINNILNQRSISKLDTVEKIASVYGLTGWHLIMPNLSDDLLQPGRLEGLFNAFISSNEEGRDHIAQVAEREAKYNARNGK